MEKFKFVLDYKIKELKKQIEPRENDIHAMTTQIQEMNIELENYHKSTSEIDLSIADLKLKLKAAEKEVIKERHAVSKGVRLVKKFKVDLQGIADHIQEPKHLKQTLRRLFQKYCSNYQPQEATDQDSQQEYQRQREYLERSILALAKDSKRAQENHRQDNIRVMQENALLIGEINHVRAELGVMGKKEKALEASLKLQKVPQNFHLDSR